MQSRRRDPSHTARAYLKELERSAPVSREEEVALFQRFHQDDEAAREALVRANLRFVVMVARSYEGRGVPLEELVAEGNAGLMEAIARFDETRGFKFITFAVWWIRQAMLKALSQAGRAVRVPVSSLDDTQRLQRQQERVSQELGRTPAPAELQECAGLPDARLRAVLERARGDVSLEAPRGDDEHGEMWRHSFPAVAAESDEAVEGGELSEAVAAALESLPARERAIVEGYFGLGGAEPLSLRQIGEGLGVTRERVRQLRDRALARLRREWGRELADAQGLSLN